MSAAAVLLGVATAIVLEASASPGSSTRTSEASGRTLRRLAFLSSVLLLVSTVVASATVSSLAHALTCAALVVLGGSLRAAAMRNLGPQFRTEGGAAELITTGIHGVMRHPSELGFLAWTLGLWIASPTTLSTGLAVAQLPLLAMRLWLEDAALARRFGETWSAYASHTPPFGVGKFVLAPDRHRS